MTNLKAIVDLQIATAAPDLPELKTLQQWVECALAHALTPDPVELTIRIVDETESAKLNQQFRHKTGPTNILSFPADLPAGIDLETPLLGDLVICYPLIISEAIAQKKIFSHHLAHLVIHGTLHLLGYDHVVPAEADAMEAIEIDLLATLNIANPYGEFISHE